MAEITTEVAEMVKKPSAVYEVAERTQYNLDMSAEQKDMASVLDAWAKDVGKTGCDPNHEIAQFITKTVNEEIYNEPDALLDSIFERGTIGEFDDVQYEKTVKNTLIAHEAAKGGNVERSYLNFEALSPKYVNLQMESDLSFADLRRNGWKNIATLTTFMSDGLKNKMFKILFDKIDAAITTGDQYIDGTSATDPTMANVDALALYLNEYSDGAPITVSLQKYAAKMRRMSGYDSFLSEAMKNDFNRYGLVQTYDGVKIGTISSAHKLGDGSLLIPDKKIFGFAGQVGKLDMKGEIHTYQDEDNSHERIHLLAKDFTFGYVFTNPEKMAKIALK